MTDRERGWYVRLSDGFPVCYTARGDKPQLETSDYLFVREDRPSDTHVWRDGRWEVSSALTEIIIHPPVSDREILLALLNVNSDPGLDEIRARLAARSAAQSRRERIIRGDESA